MSHHDKVSLRAAIRIHARLQPPKENSVSVAMLHATHGLCTDGARRLRRAEAKNWYGAARRLRNDLTITLDQLRCHAAEVQWALLDSPRPPIMPPQQIYHDLLALRDEFADFAIEMQCETVSVTTEPIRLEGLDLGAFTIELNWGRIDHLDPYKVLAVDPQPATRDEDVVHPHVQGETLCEGEAKQAIHSALLQGRLFDFFLVVRQTLLTYNGGSAYVAIDEWSGRRCSDCDACLDYDDGFACDRCHCRICGECEVSCEGCSCSLCVECADRCEACRQPFCESCLDTCGRCSASCCRECLDDEECPQCVQNDSTRMEESTNVDADASLHGDRLGEAGVPA